MFRYGRKQPQLRALLIISALFVASIILYSQSHAGWPEIRMNFPGPQEQQSFKVSTKIPESPEGYARYLSPTDLLARSLATDPETIPKLIHQSWKSTELPAKFEKWSGSCRMKHPDWEWVLWTDEDNLRLVQKYFPWLEKSYKALPSEIWRADLSRNLYMHIFGGVYADLDTECLQPTEKLFDEYQIPYASHGDSVHLNTSGGKNKPSTQVALFGRMSSHPDWEDSIPNAWMASSPGHPFFLQPVEDVRVFIEEHNEYGRPEELTGPVALRKAIMTYEVDHVIYGDRLNDAIAKHSKAGPWKKWMDTTTHEVILLPKETIYPYSWMEDGEAYRDFCWVLQRNYNPEKCKEKLGVVEAGSISITYWSHSHSPDGENKPNLKYIEHD